MTQHLHSRHVPGCFRCELREDEARDHQAAEWDGLERPTDADLDQWEEQARRFNRAPFTQVLALIAEVRNLRHTTEADLEYQRRLEARLAAVEALVAEWEYVQKQNRKALGATRLLLLDIPGPADFRAALAAPTDTTKENR